MRAARLRASKLPNPVICTFAPFFNSTAMMPLSSKSASIVRVASAFDILVRMARAAVSSALFTASSFEGGRKNPHKYWLIIGYPSKNRKIAGFSGDTCRQFGMTSDSACLHVCTLRQRQAAASLTSLALPFVLWADAPTGIGNREDQCSYPPAQAGTRES